MIKKWYRRWIKRFHVSENHARALLDSKERKILPEAIEDATIGIREKYNFYMMLTGDTAPPFPSATFELFECPTQPPVFSGRVHWGCYGNEPHINSYTVVAEINYKNVEFSHYRVCCPKESLGKHIVQSVIECCLTKLQNQIIGNKPDESCSECGYQGKIVCHICGLEDKRTFLSITEVCKKCRKVVCFKCSALSAYNGITLCDDCMEKQKKEDQMIKARDEAIERCKNNPLLKHWVAPCTFIEWQEQWEKKNSIRGSEF